MRQLIILDTLELLTQRPITVLLDFWKAKLKAYPLLNHWSAIERASGSIDPDTVTCRSITS